MTVACDKFDINHVENRELIHIPLLVVLYTQDSRILFSTDVILDNISSRLDDHTNHRRCTLYLHSIAHNVTRRSKVHLL